MKNIIIWIINVIVLVSVICVALFASVTCKNLRKDVQKIEQSLSEIPPALQIGVDLHVTDKSKIDVNGKNNSGTINVPTDRVYMLEFSMDSTKINVTRNEGK